MELVGQKHVWYRLVYLIEGGKKFHPVINPATGDIFEFKTFEDAKATVDRLGDSGISIFEETRQIVR